MILVLVMGILLIVVALVLVGLVLRDGEPSGVGRSLAVLEAMTGAPAALREDLDRPFGDRVVVPIQQRTLRLGRRLSGADAEERIQRKLDFAGNPRDWTVNRVMSGKVIGAATMTPVGFALSLLLGVSMITQILMVAIFTMVGFFIHDLYLYQAAYDRSGQLQRDLADAIDLLTISVESGLGFDAALQQVAVNTGGPLAEEITRVLREMQIGKSRSAALRGLAERTNVADVQTFVSAMAQADAFGIPVSQVLRVQSHELRIKRRQRAEEKAQQVPVKMTVPLIFCILPCLFIAVMGPAAISLMQGGL